MPRKRTLRESIDFLTRKMEEIEVDIIETSELSQLTRKQIYYLDVINQMKNPTLSEIADRLGLSRPSVTVFVEKLVKQGYLEKVKSDEDRRVSHIHLAEKGNIIAKLHDTVHERIEMFLTQSLNDTETKQLTAILNKAV